MKEFWNRWLEVSNMTWDFFLDYWFIWAIVIIAVFSVGYALKRGKKDAV